ncbi:MAG: alpha-1,4-glucan--maltose-1-phosphate maltosyltransferase [Acidimicrobiales bacterium]
MTGRIVIEDLRPRTPTGRYPARAVVGERVPVSATIFRDGHDILAARVRLVAGPVAAAADAANPAPAAAPAEETIGALVTAGLGAAAEMLPADPGNDLWEGAIVATAMGLHHFVVEAWTDRQATWAHKTRAKLGAGQPIDVELAEGIALFESRAAPGRGAVSSGGARDAVAGSAGSGASGISDAAIADALAGLREGMPALALATPLPGPEGSADFTTSDPMALWVDRPRAANSAWYELFPRSYGGFKGVEARIPAIAGMGFDVLYLPPIHPIGETERKGRDNTLGAGPDDPGSPWAIGSRKGGHTAIDAELGTFDDFSHLLSTAREFGMEVALDYALQCSPDHPWVRAHPEWFHHRPDGSIAYAENPPKKYQDIYPINFWPDSDLDRWSLWEACRDILEFWIDKGVAIFRVDNPHTKPVAFWEWLLGDIRAAHPEVLFLAEAFTRPKVMAKLAEVGFTQSYTYFTWRTEQHGPEGLRAYLEELAGDKADFMRPNFWPNTPDILSGPLRDGPPAAFAERLVLAATMSPNWGMYSGFELYENEPASPFNEEYRHSEKYEICQRDFDRPDTLAPLAASVNAIRRRHPALQQLRRTRFHGSDNQLIVAYSKISDDGRDVMLMVVSLDPYHAQSSVLTLDLDALGLSYVRPYTASDELSGEAYTWSGPNPYVLLEPWARVAHILHFPGAWAPALGSEGVR